MAEVAPPKMATTKATAVESATAEASPVKSTTKTAAVEATAAMAAPAPAVASSPSCLSERDRSDSYETQQFKLFHTSRSSLFALGAMLRPQYFAVLRKGDPHSLFGLPGYG